MSEIDTSGKNLARVLHRMWNSSLSPSDHDVVKALLAERDALQDLSERLRLEAQTHAQEARTANSTIAEIYQACSGATGEPGNWHGAQPVIDTLNALQGQIDAMRKDAERLPTLIAMCGRDKSVRLRFDKVEQEFMVDFGNIDTGVWRIGTGETMLAAIDAALASTPESKP